LVLFLLPIQFIGFMKQKNVEKKMTQETKKRIKRTIFRFVQGTAVGSIVT